MSSFDAAYWAEQARKFAAKPKQQQEPQQQEPPQQPEQHQQQQHYQAAADIAPTNDVPPAAQVCESPASARVEYVHCTDPMCA